MEPLQVTTLGEVLVVMNPLSEGPLRHVARFEKHFGGAEFNAAIGLSRLGHQVGWAGGLGDDEFGWEILAFARGEEIERLSSDPRPASSDRPVLQGTPGFGSATCLLH